MFFQGPVGTFDLQPSIFMGGSGGRGAAGTGGRGGGIIYIHAKHIQAGTNAKIESRGQFAGEPTEMEAVLVGYSAIYRNYRW